MSKIYEQYEVFIFPILNISIRSNINIPHEEYKDYLNNYIRGNWDKIIYVNETKTIKPNSNLQLRVTNITLTA